MNILMTNDDGVHSDGIVLLAEELAKRGHTVTVCAPERNQSASSHSITMRAEYHAEKLDLENRSAVYYAVDAKPVDCVQFALRYLKIQPDLLISGINNGMNIGSDVIYSGTVGGAREGALSGVPSWAVSVFYEGRGQSYSFSPAITFILENFESLFAMVAGNKTFLNVNVPVNQPVCGVKICKLAKSEYSMHVDKTGENTYCLDGLPIEFDKAERGTDLYYAMKGYATVTPLTFDATDYAALKGITL
ncbi:MAG: 5'/3'-nucleotidase SurE [Clostridia bacterium]|nr:5'/3'-nucleotidase SurE [Clostridia bacterium]